jgi:hypothetical protein
MWRSAHACDDAAINEAQLCGVHFNQGPALPGTFIDGIRGQGQPLPVLIRAASGTCALRRAAVGRSLALI